MNQPPSATAISGPMLVVLQVLNGLYALCIAGLVVFCLVNPDFVFRAMKLPRGPSSAGLAACLLWIATLGFLAAVLVHFVLGQLRAIVATVRDGNPFVLRNARRLRTIAWLVLAGEGLRLAIGGVVEIAKPLAMKAGIPVHIDIDFSLAPWLAVLLLFVLARVFADGARMRDDLEGTV